MNFKAVFLENQLMLIDKAGTQPYLGKCRIQNLVVYNTLPESFACLFDPQRTFSNPLRAVFSKIEFFYFPLYTRGLLGCLLGFWPPGPTINHINARALKGQLAMVYCASKLIEKSRVF